MKLEVKAMVQFSGTITLANYETAWQTLTNNDKDLGDIAIEESDVEGKAVLQIILNKYYVLPQSL